MNILILANNVNTVIGGAEVYNCLLYNNFKQHNFYELPFLLTSESAISTFDNVKILDDLRDVKKAMRLNSKLPKFLLNTNNKLISRVVSYIVQKEYSVKIANIIASILEKYEISTIIWATTYFFNKKFVKKHNNKIFFVQHQTPYHYMNFYVIDYKNSLPYKNCNIFSYFLSYKSVMRYNYFKYMENIVCFDEKNKQLIGTYFPKKLHPICIPSRYMNSGENCSSIDKVYDFISPIRLTIEKNPVGICDFAIKNPDLKFFLCGDKTDYFTVPKIDNVYSSEAIDSNSLKIKYQESRFLLLFSYFEGFPIVMVEALSLGIPCIVANTFPSAEFLVGDNSDRGFLFNLYDKDHMKKIRNFVDNCDYEKLSENALEFSKNYLTEKIFNKKWSTIFKLCEEK